MTFDPRDDYCRLMADSAKHAEFGEWTQAWHTAVLAARITPDLVCREQAYDRAFWARQFIQEEVDQEEADGEQDNQCDDA